MDDIPADYEAISVDANRRRLRDARIVHSTATAAILLVGAYVAHRVPYVRGLNNLVHFNENPIKPENTYLFLFGFPAVIVVQNIMLWIDPGGYIARAAHDDARTLWMIVWPLFGGFLFVLFSLARILVVWGWYLGAS